MHPAELILAATDWSENARRAVQRAAHIGEQRGASGVLMHVAADSLFPRMISLPRSDLLRSGFNRMEKLAQTIQEQSGFEFQTQLHAGDVAASIARAARTADARLIILGRWTDSALIRWTDTLFEESIALRLLNQVNSPVLIVKQDPKKPYRRVLVAIDHSENAIVYLEQAYALAPEAEFIVVFAMDHAAEKKTSAAADSEDVLRECQVRQHEEALDRINSLLAQAGIPQKQVVKVVEYGYASKLILDKEQKFQVDLLVIGRNAPSRIRRFFFGGVASQVLARAGADVLVIPAKAKGLLKKNGVEHA